MTSTWKWKIHLLPKILLKKEKKRNLSNEEFCSSNEKTIQFKIRIIF